MRLRPHRIRLPIALCGLVILLLFRAAAAGAGASQSANGVVTDALERPLKGAEVKLRSSSGAVVASTRSNAQGEFKIAPVPPGTYLIEADKEGFRSATKIVTLSPASTSSVALALASQSALIVPLTATVAHAANRVSATGSNEYSVTAQDIQNLPRGESTNLTDVLAQMPGVAIDQNQQIHIRNTEGPQFQYQINGVTVPLDINTNPPFISMINPMFIKRLSLMDGILPSRYSYATAGVVDIETKDGCEQPGGTASMMGGQRDTIQPSFQYAGCSGNFSFYLSALYSQSDSAFSSATPAPDAIHDHTNQGQGFGFFAYNLSPTTRLSLITSVAVSENQLPNQNNLAPGFMLASNPGPYPSADINSYLNFRDYLGILALNSSPTPELSYQVAYAVHYITQKYQPDDVGELLYQGIASTALHADFDNTLQGDATYQLGAHELSAGFYLGEYGVEADDDSLVFKTLPDGSQAMPYNPVRVINDANAINLLSGIYVGDTWRITPKLRINAGVRWDRLSGFSHRNQVDPTINVTYVPRPDTTFHGGFARYMQVPSFQGISPGAPAAFAGTTGEAGPGVVNPETEDDYEWDVGVVHQASENLTVSEDGFVEYAKRYLDTGQFGAVPIFAPFNYKHGYIWGSETAITYRSKNLSIYGSATIGDNREQGVATGQFNFDPGELSYINHNYITLDHQPLYGASGGITYRWNPYSFSVDALYSSGLRGGFADLQKLPHVVQVDASAERTFQIPHLGTVTDRITLLNIFDRTNLIRPAEGIGIFQAAYGPRITVYDTLTIPLPAIPGLSK